MFESLHGFCDGIDPPSQAEYEAHVARVQSRLRRLGLAAVVVEPGASMTYLSGVRWRLSERPFLLVVLAAGDPVWVCPSFERATARERIGAQAEIASWYEHQDPYEQAARVIGAGSGRVAMDPTARLFVFAGLASALGADRIAAIDVVGDCRANKSDAELARLRRANCATKAAIRAAAAMARPAMNQQEFAAKIAAAQGAAGLSDVWVLCLFGPNAAFPHGTGQERQLRSGDFILVDTGGSLHGYRSDITRTWPFGRVSSEARDVWEIVRRAQQAAMAKIAPGVPCSEPEAAARTVVEQAGYGPGYRYFTHRLGHGIGLQVHERPYLVRGNPRILQPGMTMSNEPGIYIPGQLGVRIEDIVAVTADGNEVFGPGVDSIDRPLGTGHS
ncbi:MAG: Xaa-Pro peptidase family protein [Proteobacteria bacterium]|nr:Xaa-Pro peptidase family protein [Pseudomonadota bacterium]